MFCASLAKDKAGFLEHSILGHDAARGFAMIAACFGLSQMGGGRFKVAPPRALKLVYFRRRRALVGW